MFSGFQGTPIGAGQGSALPINETILPQVNTTAVYTFVIKLFISVQSSLIEIFYLH